MALRWVSFLAVCLTVVWAVGCTSGSQPASQQPMAPGWAMTAPPTPAAAPVAAVQPAPAAWGAYPAQPMAVPPPAPATPATPQPIMPGMVYVGTPDKPVPYPVPPQYYVYPDRAQLPQPVQPPQPQPMAYMPAPSWPQPPSAVMGPAGYQPTAYQPTSYQPMYQSTVQPTYAAPKAVQPTGGPAPMVAQPTWAPTPQLVTPMAPKTAEAKKDIWYPSRKDAGATAPAASPLPMGADTSASPSTPRPVTPITGPMPSVAVTPSSVGVMTATAAAQPPTSTTVIKRDIWYPARPTGKE